VGDCPGPFELLDRFLQIFVVERGVGYRGCDVGMAQKLLIVTISAYCISEEVPFRPLRLGSSWTEGLILVYHPYEWQ